MDTLSHGLWGGAVFGARSRRLFWAAFACGVAPDLISFGPPTVQWALAGFPRIYRPGEPPDLSKIPTYVHSLYNVTHSLLVWGLLFAILWLVLRRPPWPFGAWGLHVLADIPTHTTRFFPTPFLWPFDTPYLDGFRWATPWFLIPNYLLLIAALVLVLRRHPARFSG